MGRAIETKQVMSKCINVCTGYAFESALTLGNYTEKSMQLFGSIFQKCLAIVFFLELRYGNWTKVIQLDLYLREN